MRYPAGPGATTAPARGARRRAAAAGGDGLRGVRPARLPARLGAAAPRRRPREREGRAQADARGGAHGQEEAPQEVKQLHRRDLAGAPEPAAPRRRHPRLPRRGPQRAVGRRHGRDEAPERREGLPEPGGRLLRRQASRLGNRPAALRGRGGRRAREGVRGPAPRGAPLRPQRPGRALPDGVVDREVRVPRPAAQHVPQGHELRQRSGGGLLRPAQAGVLLREGLDRDHARRVRGPARRLDGVVPLGQDLAEAGVDDPGRTPSGDGLRGAGRTGKRPQSRLKLRVDFLPWCNN